MAYRPADYVRRLRERAEELRTIGDECRNEAARQTYLKMSRDFDRLADTSADPAMPPDPPTPGPAPRRERPGKPVS